MFRLFPFLLILLLSACAATPSSSLRLADLQIEEDTVWQGRVEIAGPVEVLRTATLTILPGTEIVFSRRDADGDWLGDNTLFVKGTLHAEGTRQQPIVFRSAEENPRPGDWNEIRADFARELILRHCVIRDSVAGLHAHYTKGLMENCRLQNNIDGSRFGEARFTIRNCLIEKNEAKGLLIRQSTMQIEKNIFRNNGTGLFFMEGDRSSEVLENNFYQNQYHLRLGDFARAKVVTRDNWFGTNEPESWMEKIYDQRFDPSLGSIKVNPAEKWRAATGLQDQLDLVQKWKFETDGFVDASPLIKSGKIVTASWDGNVYALDEQGKLLWKTALGAEIDASPVVSGNQLFVQNWQREVFSLDIEDGSILWKFNYPESPADDHRQGALLPFGDSVLLPSWGGTLYALDKKDGSIRWQLEGYLPLRAAPVTDGRLIYLSSGDGRFTAISPGGEELWSNKFNAPVLTRAALTPDGPVVVARDGRIRAFMPSGKLRWGLELAEASYYSAPVYDRGMIYLATAAGQLRKIDAASGELIWQLDDLGAFYGTPMILGERLFIGNNHGQLYAINTSSAELLVTFRVGRDIQTTPVFYSGKLIFGARDGNLYALELVEK